MKSETEIKPEQTVPFNKYPELHVVHLESRKFCVQVQVPIDEQFADVAPIPHPHSRSWFGLV